MKICQYLLSDALLEDFLTKCNIKNWDRLWEPKKGTSAIMVRYFAFARSGADEDSQK